MKKILSALILTTSIVIFAQESKENKWILKLNTTQLVDDFSFPTVMFSAERIINPYFSVSAEAGIQLYETTKSDSTILKPRGFKTNLEGRFYISKFFHKRVQPKRNEPFIGLQFFYRKNQKTDGIYYYPINDDTFENGQGETFGVKKRALGVNLILGNQFSLSKSGRFILEPYAGIGYMNRKIKNTNLRFDETKYEIDKGFYNFSSQNNTEGDSGDFVNFIIGFRIGYRL